MAFAYLKEFEVSGGTRERSRSRTHEFPDPPSTTVGIINVPFEHNRLHSRVRGNISVATIAKSMSYLAVAAVALSIRYARHCIPLSVSHSGDAPSGLPSSSNCQ